MTEDTIRDFKWLKSIRLCVKNGYMTDESCHRIQEYFHQLFEEQEKHYNKAYKQQTKGYLHLRNELEKRLRLSEEEVFNAVCLEIQRATRNDTDYSRAIAKAIVALQGDKDA